MNIQIISIEGNIGSGKSTLISNLKMMYKSSKILFLEEPVEEWVKIKDKHGFDIITKFYENQERYAFSFQMMAYISRLSMLKRAIEHCKQNEIYIIICERSLYTDNYVFCKMLYDAGKIESIEYQIYNIWFDEFIKEIPKTTYIYIQTNPDTAYKRVQTRNREGEIINLKYLIACNKYHNQWLNSRNSFIIDGDYTMDITYKKVDEIIKKFI
jgi:deoxycitidine kinase/deoxyguanosine kinase